MKRSVCQASSLGLATCHTCGRLERAEKAVCPRCGSAIELRGARNVTRTLALMFAALALYVPSHLLPILTTEELGIVEHSTILAGMMTFWKKGDYPIALVIFSASILIPFLKIGALVWLCAAAKGKVHPSPRMLGRMYWFTELLGRWSMVDIFVVGILVALVQVGNYLTVVPGPGALAFAGVVVLTMLAAMSFDPRLLWDQLDKESNPKPKLEEPHPL